MPPEIGPVKRKVKVKKPKTSTSRGPQGLPTQSSSSQKPVKARPVLGPPTPTPASRSDAAQNRGANTPTKPKVLLRRSRRKAHKDYIGLNPDRALPGGNTHGIDATKSPQYREVVKYLLGKERSRLGLDGFRVEHIPDATSTEDLAAELHVARLAERKRERDVLHPLGKDTYTVGGKEIDLEQIALTNTSKTGSLEASLEAPVLKVLEQTTRPLHGIAAATDAALKGENIPKAALRGIKNEDKKTFGQILDDAGAPAVVSSVAGFGLDVALDPTTYLTLGTGTVARKAAADAASKTSAKALAAGLTKEQAARAAERAATQAARRASGDSGLTVKFAGKEVPGVRKATARAVPTRVRRKVADSKVAENLRHVAADVNPDIAAAGVTKADAQAITRATRTARAKTQRGAYEARQRAIAIESAVRKQLGEENYRVVIDALEADDLSRLTPELRQAAVQVRDLFRYANRTRRQAGVPAGEVKRRAKVKVPAVTADAVMSAREVARAQRAVTAAERRLAEALEARGVGQGRAEILSREVAGPRGERTAEGIARMRVRIERAEKRVRTGTPREVSRFIDEVERAQERYPGGARGVGLTAARHDLAADDLAAAQTRLTGAQAAHAAEKELGKTQRQQRHEAIAANERREATAKGYVPHVAADAAERTGRRVRRKASGAVSSASIRSRNDPRPLSEIRKDNPGAYSEDLPQLVAGRMSEAARVAARAELHRTLADIGRPVPRDGSLLGLKPGEAVFHVKGSTISEITDSKVLDRLTDATVAVRGGEKLQPSYQALRGGRFVIASKQAIDHALEGAFPEMQGPGIIRGLDKVQGGFKAIATVPNPGFHLRNLVGDTQNAYLADTVPRLARNVGQSARALKALGRREEALRDLTKRVDPTSAGVKIGGKRVSYDDLAREAEQVGAIRSGFIARELPELAQKDITKGKDRLHRFSRLVQNREDVIRLATYIGSRKRGLTPAEAAERTAKYHFDYGHLSQFERQFARRAMPFYTFSARNIPLQARSLVAKPGKFANYQKLREELGSAFGFDDEQQQNVRDLYTKLNQAGVKLPKGWERYLSEYEQRNAGIPLSIGGDRFTVSAGLPLQDLGLIPGVAGFEDWANRAMSLATPIVKTPTELAFNVNFFFRDKLESDTSPLVPAPAFVGGFPKAARDRLGIRKGTDDRTGKKVWMWPGRVDYAARTVPGPPSWAQRFAKDEHAGTAQRALAYAGIKATKFDPADAAVGLAYERMFAIQKAMAGLRQQLHQGRPINADNPTKAYRRLQGQLELVEEVAYQAKAIRGDKHLPTSGAPSKGSTGIDWGDDGAGMASGIDWGDGDGAAVPAGSIDWGD